MLSRILFLSLCLPTLLAAQSQHDSAEHFFDSRIAHLNYNSAEWQSAADSALMIDSTVGFIWQLRSMPYFKDGDYGSGMQYLPKAAQYNPVSSLPYMAFMKCIFMKDYEGAIRDFQESKQKGYGIGLMDHSYDFFLGICYMELDSLNLAQQYLQASIAATVKHPGENWVHYNEWFYMGMLWYKKHQYPLAIPYFEMSLKQYDGYPPALFYKAQALAQKGNKTEALQLLEQAKVNIAKGIHSTEDNDFYVNYPYTIYAGDVEELITVLGKK
ncbi:MAG: hypothetical protein H0X33_01220 [Taibaiella sp.]|nr:hypothetical protein [Taibaiella sp.]